jgi:hypothetical protein
VLWIDQELSDYLIAKWPSRGDSVLFDWLVWRIGSDAAA